MKLFKDFAKKNFQFFSFLVNYTTLSSVFPLRFRKNLYKMTVSEKIRTIDNKIEQNKAQYGRQNAKILALSSENVGRYEFLTSKDVLREKDLLDKVATIKIFKYLRLGSEVNRQTEISKKQYQKLHKVYKLGEKEEDEKKIYKIDENETKKKRNVMFILQY